MKTKHVTFSGRKIFFLLMTGFMFLTVVTGYALSKPQYIIITTAAIESNSAELGNFAAEKERLGFVTEVITEEEWGGGAGDAAAENIRAWLKANHASRNIEYVLLIGDPRTDSGDVPMKWANPVYNVDEDGGVFQRNFETDFYYADLTGNWNLNGDSRIGQYPDDYGAGGADCEAEVFVGRIPYYGSMTALDGILARTITYTTTPDVAWRKKVLLPSSEHSDSYMNYQYGEALKISILEPSGYKRGEYYRIYKDDKVNPEYSPTNIETVTNMWNALKPGLVLWAGHGGSNGATDIMSSASTRNLDKTHPAFVFQGSCNNAAPADTNNLSYALLKNTAITAIGAVDISGGSEGNTLKEIQGNFNASNAQSYEYGRRMLVDRLPSGKALYDMRTDMHPTGYINWRTMLEYNVYGDPSMSLDPPFIQVDGGDGHAIALTGNGTVWAWGANSAGQLGDDSGQDSYIPKQVAIANVRQIAAGRFFNLALLRDGTVMAWGSNKFGQLGTGDYTDRPAPLQVAGLSGVVKISAGAFHCLALKSDGTVMIWGYNSKGQLGDGTTTNNPNPAPLASSLAFADIAAGYEFSAGLTADGYVWTWGDNAYGQCGVGTIGGTFPDLHLVLQLDNIRSIAAGCHHIFAIDNEDALWGWGLNQHGELGQGNYSNNPTAAKVQIAPVDTVAAGLYHSIALAKAGTLYTWGSNSYGQLSRHNVTKSYSPYPVGNKENLLTIGSGWHTGYGINSNNRLIAWGNNISGELGAGTKINYIVPVETTTLEKKQQIAAGSNQSFCINYDGTYLSWGRNQYYQLANGNAANLDTPGAVPLPDHIAAIASRYHTLILTEEGDVYACGLNTRGQVGIEPGDTVQNPVKISALSGIVKIAAGGYHSLALKNDGTVWVWGYNNYGQLGLGDQTNIYTPVMCTALQDITDITAGDYFSAAVDNNGKVYTWGHNTYGNLGNGTYTDSSVPVMLDTSNPFTEIRAGSWHVLALTRYGDVWAWGHNNQGQLGIGQGITDSNIPVRITTLSDVQSLAAGFAHNAVLTGKGMIWTWGYNNYGQVGNGTNTNQYTPVQITENRRFTGIACGSSHTIAYRCDDNVYAWGYNYYGQLGIGSTTDMNEQTKVLLPDPRLDVPSPSYKHEITADPGSLNYGVACMDDAAGTGYIMYSAENVFTRFTASPPNSDNAEHFIGVKYTGGAWKYDNNSALVAFTPCATDILMARVDFSADTVENLYRSYAVIQGIACGYAWGDMEFAANVYNGAANAGEFGIAGTHFTPNIKTGNLQAGIAAQEAATGTGFIMYSAESVHTRFAGKPPHSLNADHFICVKLIDLIWYYDNNQEYVPFTPRESDILLYNVDFEDDTAVSLYHTAAEVEGIQSGFTAGDLLCSVNRFNGVNNAGEFEIDGTFIMPNINVKYNNWGIYGDDDATGTGYILYSAENLHNRLESNPKSGNNADHLIMVKYADAAWYYFVNEAGWLTFTPRESDILIADVDFDTDALEVCEGVNNTVHGIHRGIQSSGIVFFTDTWIMLDNDNEVSVQNNYFAPLQL